MKIVVAPDTFKGSITAAEVVAALGAGLARSVPGAEVVGLPVADGGEGTLDAAVAAGFARVPVTVAGPTGEPVRASYARRGRAAVVEMADACGLGRLPGGVPAPLTASSHGLGEVLRAALDAGCQELVVGIGGSASTDGGAGMLGALGARLLDGSGEPLAPGGAALAGLARLDLADLHPGLATVDVVVACDVDNPLLGPHGAAAVYGPQKGADPHDVVVLDAALAHLADHVAAATGADRRDTAGAGAAGGVGFAAVAVLGATLRPGIDLLLDLVGFDDAVVGAALVVTGEGSLDAQSLRGKAPYGVAQRAAAHGVPVVAVCGRLDLDPEALRGAGIARAWSLLDLEPDLDRCLADPAPLLDQLGEQVGEWLLGRAPRAAPYPGSPS